MALDHAILFVPTDVPHSGGKSFDYTGHLIIYTATATQRARRVVIYKGWPMRFCYLHSGSDAQRDARKVLQFTIDSRWDCVIYTATATNSARSVVIHVGSATWCHQSGAKGPHRDDAFGDFSEMIPEHGPQTGV